MILLLSAIACKGPDPVDTALDCDTPGQICTVAGTGLAGLGDEGVDPLESHLYLPIDLAVSPDGMPMILDWNNHRLRVIQDGVIKTVAGTGLLGDGPEGPGATAAFNHPTNLAFDGQGGVYIAAWHNSRIEHLDSSYNLSFECGTGARSYTGDGLDAKSSALDLPSSVTLDDEGRLYLTDQANQLIRYVDEDHLLWTLAGTQRVEGYSGDGGPATSATFHASVGQAADPANRIAWHDGAIYLADTGNSVIRVVDLETGVMDTFAGAHSCDEATGECTSTPGYAGDGGPKEEALFNGPTDLAWGPDGALYVADTSNHCVRRIDADGTVSTAAGVCGEEGFNGDGQPATSAHLTRPYGVDVDKDGRLWIADTYNHRIRVVAP